MTNNDILKKLRVALKLRDDEIVDILALVDFRISKSELGAFFRKEDHPKYVECGDQILRNFLNGLVIHLRGPLPNKSQNSKPAESNPKQGSLKNDGIKVKKGNHQKLKQNNNVYKSKPNKKSND